MVKFSGTDHRIYIKVEENKAIGFIRTGEKKLFYHDNMGHMKELNPTCVLDIYVHENYQRTGNGKEIFECFLKY
jgi:alpha-tubulin N-acetyltransferase 1